MQGRENKEWSLLTHDVHTTFFQLLNYGLYWRVVAGDHQGFPIANRYRNQIFILSPASPTASNVNWTTIHGHEKFLICELYKGWKTDQNREVGIVSFKSTILDPSLFQHGFNLTNINVGLIIIFLPFGLQKTYVYIPIKSFWHSGGFEVRILIIDFSS